MIHVHLENIYRLQLTQQNCSVNHVFNYLMDALNAQLLLAQNVQILMYLTLRARLYLAVVAATICQDA